jgi:hypothetical protein
MADGGSLHPISEVCMAAILNVVYGRELEYIYVGVTSNGMMFTAVSMFEV